MPRRKVLLTLLAAGLVGSAVGTGTFAAFSGTTDGTGTFEAGTVAVADNDSPGTAMLTLSNARPGDGDTSCIEVTYVGSLDATLRLYGSVAGGLAPYLTLEVTRGSDPSPTFDSCTGFTADAVDYIGAGPGVVFSGKLSTYPASWGTGIVDPPSGPAETWSTSEVHVYRFVIGLDDADAAQGLSATATLTWEVQNA